MKTLTLVLSCLLLAIPCSAATSHARYVTFQMAEVLVSRSLFYEILAKIHRLKPVPIGYD